MKKDENNTGKYLNKEIKDIIDAFPDFESILEKYDIGCGPCSVGTCLLKDIVEIHRLPSEKNKSRWYVSNKPFTPAEIFRCSLGLNPRFQRNVESIFHLR